MLRLCSMEPGGDSVDQLWVSPYRQQLEAAEHAELCHLFCGWGQRLPWPAVGRALMQSGKLASASSLHASGLLALRDPLCVGGQ